MSSFISYVNQWFSLLPKNINKWEFFYECLLLLIYTIMSNIGIIIANMRNENNHGAIKFVFFPHNAIAILDAYLLIPI